MNARAFKANLPISWRVARYAGILVGGFLLVSTLADLFKLVPYSNETPPFQHRALKGLPLLTLGVLLVLPYSSAHKRTLKIVAAGLILASLVFAVRVAEAVTGYLSGEKHWAIIPTSVVFFAIVASNAAIAWKYRRSVNF